MGGGTYVHHIEGGVAFGAHMPDFDTRLHGANERMHVEDMLTACKIFAQVICDLCAE
jgi:succinyl-diaminopimelate desuccinylase